MSSVSLRDIAGPAPGWVDAAWWEVYGSSLRLQPATASADQWLAGLATAWCLVRSPASLPPGRQAEQEHMVRFLSGQEFYLTVPGHFR